jgi:hypothetical protein
MKFEFDNDDDKLEAQLRQFRPEMPHPPPDRVPFMRNQRRIRLAMLGAVAAVLLAVLFIAKPSKPKPESNAPVAGQIAAEPVTLGQLRRFADDPSQLESQLDSLSRVLPDVHRHGGVLSKLAQ